MIRMGLTLRVPSPQHSGAPPPGPAFGRPDDRLRGEPGIHNHRLEIMDSGLATGRWRPGMTEPRFVDSSTHMIGLMESMN